VEETPPPTAQELELLRTIVDPLNVRELEFLSGGPRRAALERILAREAPSMGTADGSGILTGR
jgi:hypothetical protein